MDQPLNANQQTPPQGTPQNFEPIRSIKPKKPTGIILSVFVGALLLITVFITVNGSLKQQQTASHASFSGIVSGSVYRFINKCSGETMEVSNNSTQNGAQIVQWPWADGGANPNRKWMITLSSDGSYTIRPMNSLMYLAIGSNATSQGAMVIQQANLASTSANEEWAITPLGNNLYKVVNRNSNMAIGISSCSQGRGAPIQQWQDDNSLRLQWTIEQKMDTPVSPTLTQIVTPTCTPEPPQCIPGSKLGIMCPAMPTGGWCSTQPTTHPTIQPKQQTKYWLLNENDARALTATSIGANFITSINSSKTYEILPHVQNNLSDPLPNATHVMTFTSYQDIWNAFKNNQIPASVKVIEYNNSDWSGTPTSEQQNPFTYVQMASQLTHLHGLLFMSSPAANLGKVLAPSAPDKYTGYLQAQLATLSKDSDIFEIQAENSPTSGEYYSFVQQALFIARSSNSKAIILLGIIASTNGPTSSVITDEINRTFNATDGYRFMITPDSSGNETAAINIALPVLQSMTSY